MESVNVAMITAIALLNLGLAVLVGAVLVEWQLWGQVSNWAKQRRTPLRWIRLGAALWVALILVVVLALEVATMAEVSLADILPALGPILVDTQFGRVWLSSFCVVMLLLWLQSVRGISTAIVLLCGILLITFAVSRGQVSHAVIAGFASWSVAVEALHLLLMSVWVGAVVLSGLHTLRQPCGQQSDDRDTCARYINALLSSATLAIVGIVLTGLFNTWRSLGTVNHIVDSPWGLILLGKLILVVVAAGLGAYNRWAVMPSLLAGLKLGIDTAGLQKRFVRVLQVEASVLTGVVVTAAFLSATATPISI